MSDAAGFGAVVPPGTHRAGGGLARWSAIVAAVVFLALFLLLPLVTIFVEAFRRGAEAYFESFSDPDLRSAVRLTLLVAALSVPFSVIVGLAAAWLVTRFDIPGRNVLISLIDLPFSVSPVIAGLVFVLLFGAQGFFGEALKGAGFEIIFALPGIVLATMFVTFPFVAREVIPHMQALGTDEEEAARLLGASGLRTFLTVTLPNVKWSLLYGVLLCNARAMGEFGAVSVVSGRIRGLTNTLPLQVETFYNEYNGVAAFAAASLLAMLALVTLALKSLLEWRFADDLAASRRH